MKQSPKKSNRTETEEQSQGKLGNLSDRLLKANQGIKKQLRSLLVCYIIEFLLVLFVMKKCIEDIQKKTSRWCPVGFFGSLVFIMALYTWIVSGFILVIARRTSRSFYAKIHLFFVGITLAASFLALISGSFRSADMLLSLTYTWKIFYSHRLHVEFKVVESARRLLSR
eukprot:TRINITY_DN9639_c0_g3_i1.p1 TRINITY_DN9639_c0_g3~~TRINITY_DN9639_c0_g3_i1.p1  ORF type:complete len:169 (-),score=17.51 TRINITY_DN9639_c0_g3_i1:100-606(-)